MGYCHLTDYYTMHFFLTEGREHFTQTRFSNLTIIQIIIQIISKSVFDGVPCDIFKNSSSFCTCKVPGTRIPFLFFSGWEEFKWSNHRAYIGIEEK
jgi:hypothetical protein